MRMANSESKKTKNWLSQFRNLRIANRSSDSSNKEEKVYNVDNSTSFTCSNSNLRRSLMKVHTRVKNVFKQRNNTKSAIISTYPTSSSEDNVNASLGNLLNPIIEPKEHSTDIANRIDEVSERLSTIVYAQSQLAEVSSSTPPVVPPRNFPQLLSCTQGRVPKNEIASLSNCYWYWGPVSRLQAEERLKDCPDGAFLVRDSTSDRYLFTLSFRSIGKILHTRIDFTKSGYSLADQIGYHSITELIEHAISASKDGVYCYITARNAVLPNFPVRLTLPVSRYEKVPTLKYLSRFVIRQCVIMNDIDKLPLPVSLIHYLQEGQYF